MHRLSLRGLHTYRSFPTCGHNTMMSHPLAPLKSVLLNVRLSTTCSFPYTTAMVLQNMCRPGKPRGLETYELVLLTHVTHDP